MIGSIKTLIFVLAIAAPVFFLARPITLNFTSTEDFSRRRLVWFALTSVSFITTNFWLYAIVAVLILVWADRKDSNSVALYLLMLHVIPPVNVPIPLLGNNGLFPMTNDRLLMLCILIPAAIRHRKLKDSPAPNRWGPKEFLLLAFGGLIVALYTAPDLPYHSYIPDSPTNVLRRFFLFFLDIYFLYIIVSELCETRQKMVDAAATYCLACALMAAIAMFEHIRNWLVYMEVMVRLGNTPGAAFYLARNGSVRAQASAGHSIALGNLLAIGFGLWLYLKSRVHNKTQRIGVNLLLWGGLYASGSRGAWLGATAVYFAFLAVGPHAVSRLAKGSILAVTLAGLVIVSPIGDQMLALLPQAGKPADEYRHRLAERGWELVMAHPFFGNQFPWPEMSDLRQGEGIIDLVNTYLGIALNYGLTGLFCFVTFILLGMISTYKRSKELVGSDPDLALMGSGLIAAIVGVLIMIESNSFALGCERMFYVLAALMTAYVRLPALSLNTATNSAPGTLPQERP